ncbi:MAG: 2-C-methyl-D-erythritol 2,4-cyclodiphosphate synthase [Candidatus Aminicenantales bacterium]
MAIKIGIGYDIHRLGPGRKLFLGGLEIPHPIGLVGHSDGDCLIHAIIDALLGALGEPDIGQLFPDSDARYRDIRSTLLLERVVAKLKKKKIKILNVDAVIVAERPRLAPYVERMKGILGPILGLRQDAIGIKAKTNEGLGVIGQGQAVACWAVALLKEKASP